MSSMASLFIGLRYSRAKSKSGHTQGFISFISFFSIAGIALGLTALITVSAVMNGFEARLKNALLGMVAHIEVSSLAKAPELKAELLKDPKVLSIEPHYALEAVIQSENHLEGVRLGTISDKTLANQEMTLHYGSWKALNDKRYGIGISYYLSQKLSVNVGDTLRVTIPSRSRMTPLGRIPATRLFEVRTIFSTSSQADLVMAFTSVESIARVLGQKGASPQDKIQLKDPFLVEEVLTHYPRLKNDFDASTWQKSQGALFSAVAMEKRMMGLMMFLIVLVAVFNIISALSMMVNQKTAEVAILQTLGLSQGQVQWVFIIQGLYNGVLGTLIGTVIGIALALNINDIIQVLNLAAFNNLSLSVVLDYGFIALMAFGAVCLSFLATLMPAYRAASIQPAEVLRYE